MPTDYPWNGFLQDKNYLWINYETGTNRVTSNVTVLIDFEWDIQLYSEKRGAESDTETKLSYIKVI
ncbi:MAG: hypothetical protein GY928_18200 [Colwellia sp.]|nr:hypothetical protein [Colwellia sp.]